MPMASEERRQILLYVYNTIKSNIQLIAEKQSSRQVQVHDEVEQEAKYEHHVY